MVITPLNNPIPLLTIAGSDSGGAAGLQADLKTWTALGAYGMSAITAVTAQNSARVVAVHYLPPEFVAAQIDAVLSDYGAAAIKTGFLGRVAIIEAVAERLAHWRDSAPPDKPIALVVDPVLVNHRGEAMFGPEVVAAYRDRLLPLADLITPNVAEASLLWGNASDGPRTIADALVLVRRLPSAVLLKGLRRDNAIIDLHWDGHDARELSRPRIDTANTHGSGDTLSAAICAFHARGHDWVEAIELACAFTHAAIRRGANWRLGAGHGPLGHMTGAEE